MPELKIENGGTKQFNRRFKAGCVALGLITISYYVVMFKGLDINWFLEYAKMVVYVTGAVIIGLSATDAILNWRSGK